MCLGEDMDEINNGRVAVNSVLQRPRKSIHACLAFPYTYINAILPSVMYIQGKQAPFLFFFDRFHM
uniref:ATP binding protein n=1 Tax=Rhizophora mucronata TaxID=61149 RepID=A0A2P2JZG8_RHIMU